VLALGAALICFGYYVFLGLPPWSNLIWMNLGLSIFCFILCFGFLGVLDGSVVDFDSRVPAMGPGWVVRGFYVVAAISAMAVLGLVGAPFLTQLLVQLFLLLFLFIGFTLLSAATRRYQEVNSINGDATSRLDSIRRQAFEIQGILAAGGAELEIARRALGSLQDDVRYLSAAPGREGARIDAELSAELGSLKQFVSHPAGPDDAASFQPLERCLARVRELLRQRKACREA